MPRPKRHGRDVLATDRIDVVIHEGGEIGRRSRCGDAQRCQLRSISLRKNTREQCSLAALRVPPDRESACRRRSRALLLCFANGIEDGTGFTVADEVGMRFGRAKARIIGGGHDIAMFDEGPKSLDLLEQEDREARGRNAE